MIFEEGYRNYFTTIIVNSVKSVRVAGKIKLIYIEVYCGRSLDGNIESMFPEYDINSSFEAVYIITKYILDLKRVSRWRIRECPK